MNSGNNKERSPVGILPAGCILCAVLLMVLRPAYAADTGVLQFDRAPRASLGIGYAASSTSFDTDGTVRDIPAGMRYSEFSTDVSVKYRWKEYWFGTAFTLKRIAYVSDISDRSHIGLGDLQSYLCRVDGPAMSGIRLTVPTGSYEYGLGSGAFKLTPFVRYRYVKKLTVTGDLIYSFRNPDDARSGTSLGIHAAYRWYITPLVSFRYAYADKDPWTSVEDSPSLLLTLGAEVHRPVTGKYGVYGRVLLDAWGRDAERFVRIGCGVYAR